MPSTRKSCSFFPSRSSSPTRRLVSTVWTTSFFSGDDLLELHEGMATHTASAAIRKRPTVVTAPYEIKPRIVTYAGTSSDEGMQDLNDTLDAEIERALAALPVRNAPALRALQRRFSRRIAGESAREVLPLARRLVNAGGIERRFIAYELVAHHPAASGA